MRTVLKIVGGMAFMLVSFFATLWALDTFGTSCPAGERFELKPPFFGNGGRSFSKALPALESLADSPTAPARSPIILCEGNIPLGPAHTLHADIVAKGAGRYSHWTSGINFSSSDGSDPNTNGQSYVVVKPR